MGKEINKIIESQNLVGKQAENLTNAFNELYNYVNNYFSNLDVQNEIDNKLNEMAADGTLASIIASYVNVLKIYETVNEMKTTNNLIKGSIVKTLGYYKIGDGGRSILSNN